MFAMIVVTRTWRIESDGRRRCCRCRTEKKVVAAIVNVQRVIATVHILSSLLCGEEKSHNPLREVLGNHR